MGYINGDDNLGNTKAKLSYKKKVRNGFLVMNSNLDKTEEVIKYLERVKAFQYMLITEHHGTEHLHRHIYVQYNKPTLIDNSKIYHIHVDEAMGSAQQCIDYLMCRDKKHPEIGVTCKVIYENGKPLYKGNINTIRDLKEIKDINEVQPRHLNTWLKVRSNKISINEWHKKVKVIYMWGDSGLGKSLSVTRTLINNHETEFDEIKHIGEFWHGIGGDEVSGVAVYDDFRDSDMKASEFVNFIDYNVHNLNYKQGSAKNKYHLIIITSTQDPKEIYKNVKGEPRKQWLRRMKIINLNNIHELCEDLENLSDTEELL